MPTASAIGLSFEQFKADQGRGKFTIEDIGNRVLSYTEAKAAHGVVLPSVWETHRDIYLVMDDFYHEQFDNIPKHWRIDARALDPVVWMSDVS